MAGSSAARVSEASVDELIASLHARDIDVLFQPILSMTEQHYRVEGFECLARGPRGSAAFLPRELFRLAARQGQRIKVDFSCLEASLTRIAELGRPGLKFFLNVNYDTLNRPDFCGRFAALLEERNIRAADIGLEIVETESRTTLQALEEVKELGVSLTLDHLGRGYADLQRIVLLQPDIVKIDRFFIEGVHRDRAKHATMRAVSGLCSQLGIEVVGEGIETMDELDRVRSAGIRLWQGHLFSPPLEFEQVRKPGFLERLAKRVPSHPAGSRNASDVKIAVIDDSKTTLAFVQDNLTARGFRVVTADSPIGASMMLVSELPDLLLLDVNMASMRGTQLVPLIKKLEGLNHTRIILHSARDAKELDAMARAVGADGYIQKSDDPARLEAQICEFLARPKA